MKSFLFDSYTFHQEHAWKDRREQLRQDRQHNLRLTRGRWQCYLSGCMILQNQMDEAVMIE